MSHEEKKDNPPSDDVKLDANGDAASSVATSSTTNATSEKSDTDIEAVKNTKKSGLGFLRGRNTASTDTASTNAEAKVEENKPNTQPAPAGVAEKLFIKISEVPLFAILFLVLYWLLHQFSSIWLPSVYYFEELYLVEIYQDMLGLGQWIIPPTTENMEFLFPVFFWFMALVDFIPLPSSIFLPLVSALSFLIALLGVYYLSFSLGLGKRVSFAAVLMSFSCLSWVELGHIVGPELLGMGLFSFALAFLFRGWIAAFAPIYLILGFLCTALAALCMGYLPLWTVLISSLVFIVWRGTFSRANRLDAVMGFGVFVLIFAIWLMAVILGSGQHAEALDDLMRQLLMPFTPPFWPLKIEWYVGLIWLAIGLMPWLLLPLFVSWFKVFKNIIPSLKATRKDNAGPAWLYISLFVGTILLLLAGGYSELLLAPIWIILLAKALCNYTSFGSKLFFAVIAIMVFAAGIACAAAYFAPTSSLWGEYLPESMVSAMPYLKGVHIIGVVLLLFALILMKFTNKESAVGSLLVVSFLTCLLVQPFTMIVAPSLVDSKANYHPLGVGLGTLPFGIGAPTIVLSLGEGLEPSPEVDASQESLKTVKPNEAVSEPETPADKQNPQAEQPENTDKNINEDVVLF